MADWTFETSVALEPSSTLAYLNSQLVSQGYVPPPGLQLSVLQGKDQERAIRCILSLLSQRVDDMRRFETANSKYKTQSFELDRIRTMWREECEKSSNAEREMTLYKTKLSGAQKSAEEVQKKCQTTLAELSRTRSTLQSVRNGAAMEMRRKEKEVERMLERFQKMAGGSGTMRVTGHGTVEEVVPLQVLEKEPRSLAEEALELAEEELNTLKGERERLHDVFIWTARELGALVAEGTEINPKSCIANPVETFTPLLSVLRIRLLSKKPDDAEYSRLQGIIDGLNKEVDAKEKLLKKFEDHFAAMKERSMVDVTGNEEFARERARLDIYRLELEEERRRISSADLELEENRAAFEADRLVLQEEWQALEEKQRSTLVIPPSASASSSKLPSPSFPEFVLPTAVPASSPPRKKKPREFAVRTNRSPTKSPKRRRPIAPRAPSPPPEPSSKLPTVDEDQELPPTPIFITTPPFSPLPSPPGALSLNGIGLEMHDSEVTPLPRKKKFPKHAFSPARPSPLCQPMKLSMISNISEEGENIALDLEGAATEIEKGLAQSSFPSMPAGLAMKLGAIDNNVGVPIQASSSAPSLKEKRKPKAKTTGDLPAKSLKTRPTLEKPKKEKENKAAAVDAVDAGGVKVTTTSGARRVPVVGPNASSAKGGWR